MKQGWETSTLLDVEQLWKQKQERLINEIPKPRFTQRDIIDKRAYIPSAGARHAKAKKAKLTRTYSNPTPQHQQSIEHKPTLYFHHYNHEQKQHCEYPVIDSPSSSDNENTTHNKFEKYQSPPVRNSLDYLSYAIAMTEENENLNQEPAIVLSSQPLPDISEIEPNLIEETEKTEESEVNIISPPSSPTTSAAKAIMMFVNSQTTFSNNTSYPRKN